VLESSIALAAATARLLANWNAALPDLGAAITHPDQPANITLYGTTFAPTDLTAIPEADVPPGLPDWMRSTEVGARRAGANPDDKRATLTATVPTDLRPWSSRSGMTAADNPNATAKRCPYTPWCASRLRTVHSGRWLKLARPSWSKGIST
jgi:hypothetical protein